MKILRIRLKNYRGIVDRELHFDPLGITVVSGPNEIGKSSLSEAIDLVFDELDGTTKQRVKNVQPVDRDAGAEVEIEVETGAYAFTLRKRFQRRPLTELSVKRPNVENRTGREAHERVREILTETIDPELWRALRVQQGQALEQASWRGSTSLAHALDQAAGSAQRGPREESLLAAAAGERDRYFTKTGRERRELTASATEAERAEEEVRNLDQALARLEEDTARADTLHTLRTTLEAAAEAAEAQLRTREQEFEPVSALRDVLDAANARRDGALAEEREAMQAAAQRSQLTAAYAASEADRAQRSDEIELGEPALHAARAEIEHAEQALEAARTLLKAAEAREAQQRSDLDLQRSRRDLEQLQSQRERYASLEQSIAETRTQNGAGRVSEADVEAIRAAEFDVERAQAHVESEGPLVSIAPKADLSATIDGEAETLTVGKIREVRVADALAISLPGVADVTIVAGAAAATRLQSLEEARTRLRTLCLEHAVDDHAHAVRTFAAQAESDRRVAEHEAEREQLRAIVAGNDFNPRIERLENEIQSLLATRDPSRPLGNDANANESELRNAREEREAAQREVETRQRRREVLDERHRTLAAKHHETGVRLELADQSFADLTQRLATAREQVSDEVLQRERDARGARARAAEAEWRDAKARLDAVGSDESEARLDAARSNRETRARELRETLDEIIAVHARLADRGQDGLFEQREAARAHGYRVARANDRLRARAAAAKHLHEVLNEERENVRKGYAAPLQARIEQLGQMIFGEAFRVELDEDLQIAHRILDGVSLPFDQLSAGAREQLALVTRLAAASLVGPDGGAPVVLDDALGHSDTDRLARLGDVLTRAAVQCQILVLTCAPERYAHVEGARIVELT